MAAEELGGAGGLLPRELDDQELDGALAGGDDQPVAVGLDDLAGSAAAVGDPGLVDDDPGGLSRRVARGLQVVEATGQGCIARTWSWTACAGRDQSISPSSLRSLGPG